MWFPNKITPNRTCGSQTCSSRQIKRIKVAITSYYSQYFVVIAHNIEQHCGFGSALPPEQSHITLGKVRDQVGHRGGEAPLEIFSLPLEKRVGRNLKLLDTVQKFLAPLRKLTALPGVPS